MKNIFILLVFSFILISCWANNNIEKVIKIWNNLKCSDVYKIWNISKTDLKLKWVIVSDDVKVIASPMAWIIDYINCNAWSKVTKNTLIAKISPDFNNPNIINLSVQKGSLISQKNNILALKNTTISNLNNQIQDIKQQILLLNNNVNLTKKSWELNNNDLKKQIESLQDTLKSLDNNLLLLEKSKSDTLNKINISKNTLLTNIKTISSDNLLKIDEIFGITQKNEHFNDAYENYLWVKDVSLLNDVTNLFNIINNKKISNLTDIEISDYLWKLILLDKEARDTMKNSIVNVHLTKTQIDNFYNLFLNYGNNISSLKDWWDSIDNSIKQTNTNFDTQISSLKNQITTTKNNLDNLKTNKLSSVNNWTKLQLSQLDSQLKTLKTNLSNLESNKKSQILNFDNQILQINQNISALNINLQTRSIYAWVTGIIKQKNTSKWNNVWPNSPICQIIPHNKSTKIKIYSPVELNIWDKLSFKIDNNIYEIIIENALVYKDPMTQNYIYESNYLDKKYFKDGEVIELKYEHPYLSSSNISILNKNKNKIINVPVSYIDNKINWNFIKVKTLTWVIEKEVKLWDINWNMVEVKSWIKWVNEICK